jgi:hypothetical protein
MTEPPDDPDLGIHVAHKTFVITMVSAVLFIGTVFFYILL